MNNVENKQKPIKGLDAPTKLARRQGEKSQSNIYRTLFMQDRDRVLYSAPFRLLAGKTQVYITGIDDNMRTRLTHTLEVAQIAKTVSASLKLDVELTEAIALAHDIGHTPYGHAGERELHEILNPRAKHAIDNCSLDIKASDEEYMINDYSSELGFKHNLHGVEVAIREAEITKGQSLSLTNYTLYGIGHHSSCKYKADGIQAEKKVGYYNKYDKYCLAGSNPAWSFEAFVVAQADEIAQRHHDLEDAVRGQLLSHEYVYNQIDRCFSRYFMSRDKQTMKMLKQAKENKDDAVFYAELSRLIVNMLVTRLIICSVYNLNVLINEHRLNKLNFYKYVADHNGINEQELIGFEKLSKEDGFELALKEFEDNISSNVLAAFEIQSADAKGAYIIRKVAQALYSNPRQLPDESLMVYGEEIGLFDFKTAKEKMNKDGKGRVRKEVLQAIDRIKRSVEDCKSNKQMNVSKDEIIINDIRLLRCVCNYIASQTDRSLQKLYQDFYG